MSLFMDCPNCGVQLALQSHFLGKKIRCTACQAVLQLPMTHLDDGFDPDETSKSITPQPLPETALHPRFTFDKSMLPEERRERFLHVANGLRYHLWKLWLMILCWVFLLVGFFSVGGAMFAQGGPKGKATAMPVVPDELQIVLILYIAGMLIAEILGIIGTHHCAKTPESADQRSRLFIALSLEIAALVLFIAEFFIPGKDIFISQLLNFFSWLCYAIAIPTFLKFIRNCCQYIGHNTSERYAQSTLRHWNTMLLLLGVWYGILIMMPGMLGVANGQGNQNIALAGMGLVLLAVILMIVLFLMGISFVLRFHVTLSKARQAILEYVQ